MKLWIEEVNKICTEKSCPMPKVDTQEIPVYHPTEEEFHDFQRYIESIELEASKVGLCKIIPPSSWRARQPDFANFFDRQSSKDTQTITRLFDKIGNLTPIEQSFSGKAGVYHQINVESDKAYTVERFHKLSKTMKPPNTNRTNSSVENLESLYWKTLTFSPTMYGADLSGTLFSPEEEEWNIGKLPNLLNKIESRIPGVNTPYLYFGQWRSTFAWHLEDMDLFSINYLHFGAPKQWYVIQPEHRKQFEMIASSFFASGFNRCSQYLRHKSSVISPTVVGVPVSKIVQYEGEIMITFPYAYHQGFNYGFNCAESVNFALKSWLPKGKVAKRCICFNDSVFMEMKDLFPPQFSINLVVQKCQICYRILFPSSVVLPTITDKKVHKECALLFPGISIDKNGKVTTFEIDSDFLGQTCSICLRNSGACISCTAICPNVFHISCADENGSLRDFAYCSLHCLPSQKS